MHEIKAWKNYFDIGNSAGIRTQMFHDRYVLLFVDVYLYVLSFGNLVSYDVVCFFTVLCTAIFLPVLVSGGARNSPTQ